MVVFTTLCITICFRNANFHGISRHFFLMKFVKIFLLMLQIQIFCDRQNHVTETVLPSNHNLCFVYSCNPTMLYVNGAVPGSELYGRLNVMLTEHFQYI